MISVDIYLREIDVNRSRRVRELSEIKSQFAIAEDTLPFRVKSKAVVVLTYAHWEGFYNECVSTYLSFLRDSGKKIRDTNWSMLVGTLSSEINRLKDRNHSPEAACDFVEALSGALTAGFDSFNADVIKSRSNLNFEKLKSNYRILSFNLEPFQRKRIRLDKELVGWRHGIAHGDDPDLSTADSRDHIKFTQDLLLILADQFQEEIVNRSL